MRLDKFLSEAGVASRKDLKDIIKSGRVAVDGVTVLAPEIKIPEAAAVTLDGAPVLAPGSLVLMLHKPAGFVTSTADPRDPTVLELLPPEYRRLRPVGRLDKETEGLLLFTADGALLHRLISPKYETEKEYYAETDGQVTQADAAAFAAGLKLRDGTLCRPAALLPMPGACRVILREGKYHQVRRMLAAVGKPCLYLRREREGGVALGDLKKGAWRLLTPEEMGNLQ